MCKTRTRIESELKIVGNTVWQDKPNTAAKVEALYENKRYEAVGFSKVNWPDWWNREMGIKIARGKAIAKISRGIMREQITRDREAIMTMPEEQQASRKPAIAEAIIKNAEMVAIKAQLLG